MGVSFRKSPRPSLPLKRAPPLTPTLSPSGEREETALRSSEPLRSKVGGPSKVFAILCGMGPPGEKRVLSLKFIVYNLWLTACIRGILLIYCEFLGVLEYGYQHSPINGLC